MRTLNPALNDQTFAGYAPAAAGVSMTIQGTINKTALSLLIVVGASAWVLGNPGLVGLSWVGAIGGFVVAMVTIFKKTWAPVTAPIYAALEGVFLGGISSVFEAAYPGIVLQAVMLTFGVLAALLLAYTSRLIPVTQNFRLGVVAATGGVCLVYLASLILGFFGVQIPLIHSSGPVGIGFSLIVVGIAALNLVLDFDFIERGAQRGQPKYMEWYGAFGLTVTLVWLYIEILRLLSKLRSRR